MNSSNTIVRLAMSLSPDSYVTRKGGSFVQDLILDGENVRKFLSALAWHEVTEEVRAAGTGLGNCRYFKASISRPAFLGAKPLCSLTEAERAAVRVEAAHHTNLDGSERGELVLDTIQAVPVDYVVIAVGNPAGPHAGDWTPEESVVYTWHPGMPMHSVFPGPSVAETQRQLDAGEIHPWGAVKLSAR